MIKGSLILILAIICTGCASSQANASSVKVASIEKSNSSSSYAKRNYGECKMMSNGYLVCPKAVRN
jgi:hypothetical protein